MVFEVMFGSNLYHLRLRPWSESSTGCGKTARQAVMLIPHPGDARRGGLYPT